MNFCDKPPAIFSTSSHLSRTGVENILAKYVLMMNYLCTEACITIMIMVKSMNNDYPITGLVKDWRFIIRELSPSCYVMEGRRRSGETLSKEGVNDIQLAQNIAREALKINEKYLNPSKDFYIKYYCNTELPDGFPEELREIILDEILRGNWIYDSWTGFGRGVLMANPFCVPRNNVRTPLEYAEVNDPHYWKEEVRFTGTDFFVAAAFK